LRFVARPEPLVSRNLAITLFLSAYSSLWLFFGLALETGVQLQRPISPTDFT
jgi:hypothetical protein